MRSTGTRRTVKAAREAERARVGAASGRKRQYCLNMSCYNESSSRSRQEVTRTKIEEVEGRGTGKRI